MAIGPQDEVGGSEYEFSSIGDQEHCRIIGTEGSI